MARRGGAERRRRREGRERRALAGELALRPGKNWEDGVVAMDPELEAWLAREVPEDRPSPGAPMEEQRAWIMEQEGPGAFSAEVLGEMRGRGCRIPECGGRAASRSLFCAYHRDSAVGEA